MEEFKEAFVKGNMFACGLSVDYGPSNLIVKPGDAAKQGDGTLVAQSVTIAPEEFAEKQALATGIPVGKRFNSAQVLSQAGARPWQFQERLPADGRFRVVLFAGDVLAPAQKARVDAFCARLDAPDSFLHRTRPGNERVGNLIEVLTIHASKRWDTELLRDFPAVLHPYSPKTGWAYDKVYVDDESYHEGFGDAYTKYGVDRARGCVVIVRPDQYVAWVGDLEDFDQMQAYFAGCLKLEPYLNGAAVAAEAINGNGTNDKARNINGSSTNGAVTNGVSLALP